MIYKKKKSFLAFILFYCVLTLYAFAFRSRLNPILFSLTSLTEIPFQGSSSEDDATDSSVWVKIVAPLSTIIPISVLAMFLLLCFRKRCKIIFLHVLRYLKIKMDFIQAVI